MQVATLVQADWLFLLTDVPNLFTANPNTDPTAQPIYEVADLSKLHVSSRCQALSLFKSAACSPSPACASWQRLRHLLCGTAPGDPRHAPTHAHAQVDTSTRGTQWGTGGMATKLTAGRIATAAGTRMVICSAAEPSNILKIIAGERIGTLFHPTPAPIRCGELPAGSPALAAHCVCTFWNATPTFLACHAAPAPRRQCCGHPCSCPHSALAAVLTPTNPPFPPPTNTNRGRKRWILSVPVRGEVWLDEGARRAVQDRKKSLFSAGIAHIKGDFEAQVGLGDRRAGIRTVWGESTCSCAMSFFSAGTVCLETTLQRR